jgi:hypothetical protein
MAALTVTAGNVIPASTARTQQVTAGETVTAGMPVYKKAADSKYYKAADTSAALANASGIALNGASAGQPLGIITEGDLNPGATVAVGVIYCVGDAAGAIAPSADIGAAEYVTIIGIGTTTSNISVKFQVGGVAVAA